MAGSGVDGNPRDANGNVYDPERSRVEVAGGGGGPVSGYTINGEDGLELNLGNPYMMDPATLNPAMYAEIERLMKLRGDMDLGRYMDPWRHQARLDEANRRAEVGLGNRFAAYGLSGSSAEMGAVADAYRTNMMAYEDRFLNDQMKALQAELGISGAIQSGIGGIQQGYSNFQGQMLNTVLGLEATEAQSKAADNQMIGQGLGALGTIAGFAAAGPGGAAVGSQIGKVGGAALNYGVDGNSAGFVPDYGSPNSGVPSFTPPGPMGDFGMPAGMESYYQRGYFT